MKNTLITLVMALVSSALLTQFNIGPYVPSRFYKTGRQETLS
jgi:hypothetical protein